MTQEPHFGEKASESFEMQCRLKVVEVLGWWLEIGGARGASFLWDCVRGEGCQGSASRARRGLGAVLALDPPFWSRRDTIEMLCFIFFRLMSLAELIKVNIHEVCITGKRRLFTES